MKTKKLLKYTDFKNYFEKKISDKERHGFEKNAMGDLFDQDAYEGLSMLGDKEIEQDIKELEATIRKKVEKKRLIPLWISYAASIALLIGLGVSLFFASNWWGKQTFEERQLAQETERKYEKHIDALKTKKEKPLQKNQKHKKEGQTQVTEKKQLQAKNKENSEITLENEEIAGEYEDEMEEIEDSEISFVNMDMEKEKTEQSTLQTIKEKAISPKRNKKLENKSLVSNLKKEEILADQIGVEAQGKMNPPVKEIGEVKSDQKKMRTIKGKIVDSQNIGLPGSMVIAKGTEIGSITDIDGNFTIEVPEDLELKELVASFVGFEEKKVTIERDTNILVVLDENLSSLEEIVVTAYGHRTQTPLKKQAAPPKELKRGKYKKQILEAIDYTKLSNFKGKYRIKVYFTVSENGDLREFSFRNAPAPIFEKEIERAMLAIGKWNPATKGDVPYESKEKLTLNIKLK